MFNAETPMAIAIMGLKENFPKRVKKAKIIRLND